MLTTCIYRSKNEKRSRGYKKFIKKADCIPYYHFVGLVELQSSVTEEWFFPIAKDIWLNTMDSYSYSIHIACTLILYFCATTIHFYSLPEQWVNSNIRPTCESNYQWQIWIFCLMGTKLKVEQSSVWTETTMPRPKSSIYTIYAVHTLSNVNQTVTLECQWKFNKY